MVHGIVTENGGRVEVESQVGSGTTFSVLLPRAGERVVEVVSFAPSDRARPEGAGTILLAEDEAEVRSVVVRILERAGYHVLEAENGQRAVELFKQRAGSIDLVLLDALMPILGGKEAYEEIMRVRPDARVLFTSGYVADTLPQAFLAARDLDVLTKPYRPAALLSAVHKALGITRPRA
jgi:CheY-like chemotaxis protein